MGQTARGNRLLLTDITPPTHIKQVRPERICGRHLLPNARCKLMHQRCRVLADALQDIHKVIVGIDVMHAASRDQTLYDTCFQAVFRQPPHLPIRQYARIAHGWVEEIGLDSSAYGTRTRVQVDS
jgi:hypothetical protein